MFRKADSATPSGQTLLNKSASRGFQKQVAKQFPGADEASIAELFGKHQVVQWKLPGRCLAYCLKEEEKRAPVPLFLDLSGRRDLCPTVFALWRCPRLLPAVLVPSAVSGYLLNGADLMFPGVLSGRAQLGEFAKGARAAVYVWGNPAAVGVGEWTVASKDLADPPSDMRGKALAMIHTYRDALWSAPFRPALVPC